MRILVTGATGFVASYLIPELLKSGHKLILSSHGLEQTRLIEGIPVHACDLRDGEHVKEFVLHEKPEAIIHLGAVSHVGRANDDKAKLSAINVVGTHNLCVAAEQLPVVTFLLASSALVYGGDQEILSCSESTAPQPVSAYGMSKLAAEYVVQTFQSERFRAYRARPFNHIGPGQSSDFVCTAFASRVHDAVDGSSISVGNLHSRRDFCDVRDVVRAYRLIIEKKPKEQVFVLGSGKCISVKEILETFVQFSGKQLAFNVKESLLRSNDDQVKIADSRLAKEVLGWSTEIPLRESLLEIYRSFGK